MKHSKYAIAFLAFGLFASCSKDPNYMQLGAGNNAEVDESSAVHSKGGVRVIKASGDISAALSEFRDLLGTLNIAPGADSGRREINWDGVPAGITNNNSFPGDFFGSFDAALPNGRKRGLISTTDGIGFSVSDNDFVFINENYPSQFDAFSPAKTFVAVGSTVTDNVFKVPGTNIDAAVQGFGVVFSDVNNASSTFMEFYDHDRLLGSFKVPNVGNNEPGGFSFLGVYYLEERVTRVRIHSGSAPLSASQDDISDGGGEDLVVMDDFIYSEPQQ
jgi:hypothetical protein